MVGPLLGRPVFAAISALDGEWTHTISQRTATRSDCILADGRNWRDAHGLSVRLEDRKATQSITDCPAFMESLIAHTVKRLDSEPIDIYGYPTYLPAEMRAEADKLWTRSHTTKLIEALLRNKVAIELNTLE